MDGKNKTGKLPEARLKDLLVGALYELQKSTQCFPGACENIGITPEELSILGFSDDLAPSHRDLEDYIYYCNCCGCAFGAAALVLTTEDAIGCPNCGCTYDTGYIERCPK